MTKWRSTSRSALTLGALGFVAGVGGCSAPPDNGFGFGSDDSGPTGSPTASNSGALPDAGGVQADGRASGSSGGAASSSSGGQVASSSGSSSGGSSGGSGSVGGSSSSGGSVGHTDAGASQDTGAPTDATMAVDTASAGDAGALCANASDWLTPMNQARAMVNAGEPPLVCDPIAAQVALNYANKCTWGHNANRNSDYAALGGTGQLGEDIAEGPGLTAAQAVSLWVGEQQYYDHATNTCSAPPMQSCGHYTQIVWKATTAIGCALVTCTTGSPSGGGSWQYAVCDFNPPGNYVGQPPY